MPRRLICHSCAAWWGAPVLLLLLGGAAPAEEFYFVAMFGAQRIPNNPNYSHTFATFVRAAGDGSCPTAFTVEDSFTISWLPANKIVRSHALLPEDGHNFTLPETLDIVLGDEERVSLWGPYRIDERLYNGALRQYTLLQSGEVRYKAFDSLYPTDRVSNCIHAVGSSVNGSRPRVLSPWFGEVATWVVLHTFKRYIIDKDQAHEWVCAYLGLDRYPILRRDFDYNPHTDVCHSLIKEALHIEQ